MIQLKELTLTERSQLERKELAVGAWREGEIENAQLLLDSIKAEEMTDRVAGEVLVTEASLRCQLKDFDGVMRVLSEAAPFLESCGPRVHGSFYLNRGLVNRVRTNIDEALTDYAGALFYWQEAGSPDHEISALLNLSELYLIRNNVEQARHYIDRVFGMLTENSTHICNAYDTRAKILAADGHLIAAWNDISTALEYAKGNEIWKADCEKTRDKIKERLLRFMVPVVTLPELKRLKVEVTRYALEVNDGDPLRAARMIGTSRQVIEYTAAEKGLARKPRRRTSIIKQD